MIGIIGGTFDPIHFGHLRPALEIAEQFQLNEVRFIPSGTPPHRWKPMVNAENRLNMVQLAIQDIPNFVVDNREYLRQGSSYTVDTLQSIVDEQMQAERKPKEPLLMMLGLDAFQSFTTWHQWQSILELTHIVVSTRPGYQHQKTQKWMQGRVVDSPLAMKQQQAGCIYFSEVTQLDISASQIREQLLKGKSSKFLMPEKVIEYIHDNKLYVTKNATRNGTKI